MSRERSYHLILDAMAKMQWNVSMILEAKALEAEKMRNWLLNHLTDSAFVTHKDQLSDPLEVHEQIIEVIDGLTKLQLSLSNNMKAVLDRGSSGGFGDGTADGSFSGEFDLGDKL
ncbi:restriction endonuclease subunit S [Paenibacillus sp. MER TA 81-3]|uniref:restriction endonuclease subunit S n=1 Tax=Paenibacillus sp. MER TA 81-3 TaxID=2939573 RepID=UPI00203D573F|nr:restriction endonuclease subunit S [Paenibacillus sp. MER TA 81-3]MCM3339043.1 restriction endonuclease subunit S [Paenibacillus sp. MER TA 81-3]